MDTEKLKQFILPIVLIILLIAGIASLTPKIIENYQTYSSLNDEITNKTTLIQEKQTKIQNLQARAEERRRKEIESEKTEKPFYKPVMTGMDTQAVISGEFAEILQLARANQIKIRAIKHEYDPQDDAFVKGAGDKYNVGRLSMEMAGNYSNYDNFLKEMYKHEHFLDIQSAEIVPYKKNKKVLLINFKVKLYARK